MMVGWPQELWLVRHGESEGNVANARALATGAARLDLAINDMNVSLSDLGRDQARALGRWIGRLSSDRRPTRVVVSPYLRTRQTAELVQAESGLTDLPTVVDERLRDREQGVLDLLTASGIRERYPEEAERHDYLGKFWYRPAGGESWADVGLRVRASLLELRLAAAGERVLLVTHDVPLLLARYVLEQLSVDEVVALSGRVGNCSLTRYDAAPGGMRLERFSDSAPLEEDDKARATAHD